MVTNGLVFLHQIVRATCNGSGKGETTAGGGTPAFSWLQNLSSYLSFPELIRDSSLGLSRAF
jgi:hypothetical protein